MRGICFIEPLVFATVQGVKTQTRRKDSGVEYKVGETLFLKEPYIDDSDLCFTCYPIHDTMTHNGGTILYRYGNSEGVAKLYDIYGNVKWKNKLFMPASAARYMIVITDKRKEMLFDISDDDCRKEGILYSELYNSYGILDSALRYIALGNTRFDAYMNLFKIATKKKATNQLVNVYDYKLIGE